MPMAMNNHGKNLVDIRFESRSLNVENTSYIKGG